MWHRLLFIASAVWSNQAAMLDLHDKWGKIGGSL